jgi:2-amino-4-hydroxy-6-hydroxymethyldihydropteridine diphosphokinase
MVKRRCHIGLGSNLGDRGASLDQAVRLLEEAGLRVVARSRVYRTDPVEVIDQEEFLNQVVSVETDLSAARVLEICLGVERRMGRVRTRDKGPRNIDLDLLLAGGEILAADGVTVPHPRMHLRRFVLVPLADVAPGDRHPVLGRTVAELLLDCPDRSGVTPAP